MSDIEKLLKSTPETVNPIPPPAEFSPITKEDLVEIHSLNTRLFIFFQGEIPGIKLFTGTGDTVGTENIFYNSRITFYQLLWAMAITKHPLIKEIVKPKYDKSKFDAKILVEQQIMAGMKILDLGCGPIPVFARCARAMGADVWTVDLKSAEEFSFNENSFTLKQRALEIQKHIQLDLKSAEAINIIRQRSLGNFNLVTEANLDYIDESAFSGFEGINVLPLLKRGGVSNNLDQLTLKES
ncbi:MAG: hypothetical protein AAB786_00130 [Patescibacteria group bacterium]